MSTNESAAQAQSTPAAHVSEPPAWTANVYFWSPGRTASDRRRNEKRREQELRDWLESIGLKHECAGVATLGDVGVCYAWRETCVHVYRTFNITTRAGRSNIRTLRTLATDPAAFWRGVESRRRKAERRAREAAARVLIGAA